MTLEEWAKKAREALGSRSFITASGCGPDDYDEDFNDDEVIELCKEYDELIKGPAVERQFTETYAEARERIDKVTKRALVRLDEARENLRK